MKLMHDGYMRCGEVFTVPVLHKNFTFLLGPHVSGHFFKANDDEMSQKEVSTKVIGMLPNASPCRPELACTTCTAHKAYHCIPHLLTFNGMQVYEFNVPTFGKGVVFDVDHKVSQEKLMLRSRKADGQHAHLHVAP